MVADSSGTTGSGTSLDLNSLLKTAIEGNTMGGLLGGTGQGNDAGLLALLLVALRGQGLLGQDGRLAEGTTQAQVDAAVAAALAQANQANNNSMLLLKDIQDSSQEVIAAVTTGNAALNTSILQGQIANLQGQGAINQGIAEVKYVVSNEGHENAAAIVANQTANTAQLAATLNTLAMGLQSGHAEINASIAQAKYDNTIATMNEGEKTRAAIAALAANIPTSRELDLQRQLGVAQDTALEGRLNHRIDSGNVTVTTNVNQNQAQAQMQNQIQGLTNVVQGLVGHQQAMATAINVGGYQRATQTPTNINQ